MTYTLSREGLSIAYWARSSRDTLCNLTNHSYFNLNGHASGPVTGQYIQINAGRYTPADEGSIPTGELAPVEGTPMDLRAGARIGERIDEDFPQLTMAGGYDHNWVVDGPAGTAAPGCPCLVGGDGDRPGGEYHHARRAVLHGQLSGRLPGGEGGAPYGKRWGFCLETQFFPDAIHHPEFPSPVLRAGAEYRQGDPVLLLFCGRERMLAGGVSPPASVLPQGSEEALHLLDVLLLCAQQLLSQFHQSRVGPAGELVKAAGHLDGAHGAALIIRSASLDVDGSSMDWARSMAADMARAAVPGPRSSRRPWARA